jgi:hypothetical protein
MLQEFEVIDASLRLYVLLYQFSSKKETILKWIICLKRSKILLILKIRKSIGSSKLLIKPSLKLTTNSKKC